MLFNRTRGIYFLFTRADHPFGFGPQLNISLQSVDNFDPNWNTLTDVNHRFTSSSARAYLSDVVFKSLQKLPVKAEDFGQYRRIGEDASKFRRGLVSSTKSRRFQDAVIREIRRAEVLSG
jgi:hypothetical protein